MSTVTVTTANGKTTVESPYHPGWPSEARALGGKWSGGAWVFDSRDEERVRELARDVYGTDGTPDAGGTVTVRIGVGEARGEGSGRPATRFLYGRKIATRFGRDEESRSRSPLWRQTSITRFLSRPRINRSASSSVFITSHWA
ncbi:hypothetical protein OG723_44620 (plasmid) [Streptomyces sp. NBC_01278]|uniref:hypothetical protein n=1 Tax=Streptomyces sp. NBC_01278 TaxID=2903809 RepID=UPI002E37DBB1|nr:hypothetical protein [Streptomyces sp. NBC_01278]